MHTSYVQTCATVSLEEVTWEEEILESQCLQSSPLLSHQHMLPQLRPVPHQQKEPAGTTRPEPPPLYFVQCNGWQSVLTYRSCDILPSGRDSEASWPCAHLHSGSTPLLHHLALGQQLPKKLQEQACDLPELLQAAPLELQSVSLKGVQRADAGAPPAHCHCDALRLDGDLPSHAPHVPRIPLTPL